MKIAMISDVHEQWHDLIIPECDLLISAGDYSYRGLKSVVIDFHEWLSKQPAKYIISVQGNHELWVEKNFQEAKEFVHQIDPRISFIDEGPLIIDGVKIYCSAVTPWFHNWAWNVQRGKSIKSHWSLIPNDTVILVTHGPPYGILDTIMPGEKNLGCLDLLDRIKKLKAIKLNIFGHIHGAQENAMSIKCISLMLRYVTKGIIPLIL